jgi:hypothetical protein
MKRKIEKYTGLRQVTFVPLRMSALFTLPTRAWTLAPGLWLQRLSGKIKDDLADRETRMRPPSGINPNYTVKIDSIAYGDYVLAKLCKAGKTIPDYPKDMDLIGHDCLNITKMILIGLLLQNNLTFAFANAYSFKVLASGTYDDTFIGLHGHRREEMSYTWWYSRTPRPGNSIDRRRLSKALDDISPYYRPLTWEISRVSTALSYFWNSLVSDDPIQLFTNLAILFECLLGTDRQELKHKICERAALILGKNGEERLAIYKDVKNIYDQRSKIVHGGGGVLKKKKPVTQDTFLISPKYVGLSKSMISMTIGISINLLNALLKNEEYMDLVRSTTSEGKTNEALNEFFMKRLFQG